MTPETELQELQQAAMSGKAPSHESSIAALLNAFRAHPRFLLTSHSRPDGDAVGSVLALAEVVEQLGGKVDIVLADSVPATYASLPNLDRIHHIPSADQIDPGRTAPAILLECDGIARTGLLGLEGRTLINIDHHASGRNFASVNWIDEHACAVAAMVYRIAIAANVRITPSMATCLYAAILSDTGAFTYSSTTADTFALVHDLAAHGANPSQIARDIYFSNPASKIRLLGIALSNLQTESDLAWTWVTSQDMERIGAVAKTARASSTISSASPRSKQRSSSVKSPTPVSSASVSAAKERSMSPEIAEHFGGGGHRSASGCTLHGPLEVAIDRILNQLRTGLC